MKQLKGNAGWSEHASYLWHLPRRGPWYPFLVFSSRNNLPVVPIQWFTHLPGSLRPLLGAYEGKLSFYNNTKTSFLFSMFVLMVQEQ